MEIQNSWYLAYMMSPTFLARPCMIGESSALRPATTGLLRWLFVPSVALFAAAPAIARYEASPAVARATSSCSSVGRCMLWMRRSTACKK
jgi:hypothetical protein